jgi:hypothetical protein
VNTSMIDNIPRTSTLRKRRGHGEKDFGRCVIISGMGSL